MTRLAVLENPRKTAKRFFDPKNQHIRRTGGVPRSPGKGYQPKRHRSQRQNRCSTPRRLPESAA